jgi:hypothetical protein
VSPVRTHERAAAGLVRARPLRRCRNDGSALLAAAQGQGHRSIAAKLGRPATTVRGWLRAAGGQLETLRAQAYTLQGRVESPSEERLLPAGSGLADAVAALAAAAAAAKRFLGADRYRTTPWAYIVLITGGRLLRPRPRATG